jgi:hypothetical protein
MDTAREKKVVLRRFFWNDRVIYRIGKLAKIDWFDRFDGKFAKDTYAYFADEERKEAVEKIVEITTDEEFVNVLNARELGPPKYMDVDRFVGEHFFYEANSGFKVVDRRDALRDEVRKALEETGERGYSLLKAIIDLYREGRWDKAYGGATWVDILSKVREIGGVYPAPRDLVILKSYRIYYKTGSRRYPTHTVPEEMIPTVDAELEVWIANKRAGEVRT